LKVETSELIERLAAGVVPVRRLISPWRRALLWLAMSVPYVAAVVWLHAEAPHITTVFGDMRFVVELTAALATAGAAAVAAFYSVVPGLDRRVLYLPLVPLAIWLVLIGDGCVRDWLQLGVKGLGLRPDWHCLPPAIVIGILPAIGMVVMLRRGAPVQPRASVAIGALAVAALGNSGLSLFHVGDASIMVLVWHFGSVAVLSVLAGWMGRHILNWRGARVIRARTLG